MGTGWSGSQQFRQIETENPCIVSFMKHEIISRGSHAVMAMKT